MTNDVSFARKLREKDLEEVKSAMEDKNSWKRWKRGKNFLVGPPNNQVLIYQTIDGTLYFELKHGQLVKITKDLLDKLQADLMHRASLPPTLRPDEAPTTLADSHDRIVDFSVPESQ